MSIQPDLFNNNGTVGGVIGTVADVARSQAQLERARTFIGAQTISGGGASGQIVASSVTAAEILAGTITALQIAAHTITATQIAASTITATEIAANTITAAKIAADTITANEIAANAITTSELAADSVTSAKIAANTITAGDIAANTITSGEINAGSVAAATVTATTVNAVLSAANTSISDSILARLVSATNIGTSGLSAITANIGTITSGTITGATLRTAASGSRIIIQSSGMTAYATDGTTVMMNFDTATGTLSLKGTVQTGSTVPASTIDATGGGIVSAQIQNGTIVAADIAADTITANEIAANAITVSELAAAAVTAAKIDAGAITTAKISVGYLTSITVPNGNFSEANPADGTTLGNNWTLSGTTIFTVQSDSSWGRISQVSAPGGSSSAQQTLTFPIGRHVIRAWVKTASFTPNARITLTIGTATATLTNSANKTGTNGWSLLEATADVTAAGTVTVALNASASGTGTAQFANVTIETSVTGTSITPNTITTGQLSATAIDGMTVTGATIQTGLSGTNRLVMTGTTLTAYDTSNTQIMQLDPAVGLILSGNGATAVGGTLVNWKDTGGTSHGNIGVWDYGSSGTNQFQWDVGRGDGSNRAWFEIFGTNYAPSPAASGNFTYLQHTASAVSTSARIRLTMSPGGRREPGTTNSTPSLEAAAWTSGGTKYSAVMFDSTGSSNFTFDTPSSATFDCRNLNVTGTGAISNNGAAAFTVAGSIRTGGSSIGSAGDISAQRVGATTTGAIFLGNNGSAYLFFDGTDYSFGTAAGSAKVIITSSSTSGSRLIIGSGTFGASMRAEFTDQVAFVTTNNANYADIRAKSFNVSPSDRRAKTNIKTADGIAAIRRLRGVTFNYLQGGDPSVGVIAQDVQTVFPALVTGNPENLGVNYNGLIGPLIEGVKDLDRRDDRIEQLLDHFAADVASEIGGQRGAHIIARYAEWKQLLAEV